MDSPERGEVWLVDLGYVAKVRPCLVISIPALDRDWLGFDDSFRIAIVVTAA